MREAKLDAADKACWWFAFGRVMSMAPGLPFVETPVDCVMRRKVKVEEKKGDGVGFVSALQGVVFMDDRNRVGLWFVC